MFERHFGLRENPFVAGHQHRFVYPSPEHLEALAHLRYGIENREPFVLITGEVGTGKTTALYDALSEWESRVVVALITNSALTRAELLEEIALRFGVVIAPGSSKPQLMTALERHLLAVRARQHRAMLLLDEAQNLERELLEEIRLLSNLENAGDNLLQVVLVGQPELEEKLNRPELRQLRQRITVHYRLSPLSADDTERYIQHRVTVAGGHAATVFPSEACRAIHRLTGGIPREINHLAAQSMLTAYVEDSPVVRLEHVESAAHEIEFKSVTRPGEARGAAATSAPAASAPAPAPAPTPHAAPAPAPHAAPAPAPLVASAAASAPPAAPRPSPSEGAPRTASSDAWDAWMAAIATTAEAAAKAEGEPAPVAPEPAAPAAHAPYMPPPLEPEPKPVHEPADFAATLAAAVHTPAPMPRAEEELSPAHALSARLREKLAQDAAAEIDEETPRRSMTPWLLAAAAVAVVVVSTVLWFRFHGQPGAAAVTTAPAAASTTSQPRVMPADTAARAAQTTPATSESTAVAPSASAPATTTPANATTPSTAPAAAATAPVKPAPQKPVAAIPTPEPVKAAPVTPPPAPIPVTTSTPTNAATAVVAAAKPALPPMRYGVVVHTFLARERADAESARLAGVAGLPGQVIAVREGGSDAYRIVLGAWNDRGAAERGASDLIRKGLVDEARVVPIGRAVAKP